MAAMSMSASCLAGHPSMAASAEVAYTIRPWWLTTIRAPAGARHCVGGCVGAWVGGWVGGWWVNERNEARYKAPRVGRCEAGWGAGALGLIRKGQVARRSAGRALSGGSPHPDVHDEDALRGAAAILHSNLHFHRRQEPARGPGQGQHASQGERGRACSQAGGAQPFPAVAASCCPACGGMRESRGARLCSSCVRSLSVSPAPTSSAVSFEASATSLRAAKLHR
jgi:hypothetical protein